MGDQGIYGNRCMVCGWTLARTEAEGCTPGNCSMRPVPSPTYAEKLAAPPPVDKNATIRRLREALELLVTKYNVQRTSLGNASYAVDPPMIGGAWSQALAALEETDE